MMGTAETHQLSDAHEPTAAPTRVWIQISYAANEENEAHMLA